MSVPLSPRTTVTQRTFPPEGSMCVLRQLARALALRSSVWEIGVNLLLQASASLPLSV